MNWEFDINQLKYEKFKFNIVPENTLYLPTYKGATFRGAFGHILKKITCVQKQSNDCNNCLLKESCLYSYLFETPNLKREDYFLSSKASVPHPFILEPPLEQKREYKENEILGFSLILIGKAIDYLPYIIFSFKEIGRNGLGSRKGKYRLISVNLLKNNAEFLIFNGASELFYNINQENNSLNHRGINNKKIKNGILKLNFLTPTRIKEQGDLITKPQFHQIMKSLLIRLSLLSNFHCSNKIEFDLNSIVEESKSIKIKDSNLKWYDWAHFSPRTKEKVKLGGFIGDISYYGKIEKWLPILEIGEYLHIGKATSFGLGKYELKI